MFKTLIKLIVFIMPIFFVVSVEAGIDPTASPYGVVVGPNQSATVRRSNFTKMNQAINAAVAIPTTLDLPADVIEIEVPSTTLSGFRVRGNRILSIVGQGVSSRLQFFPDNPTYAYKGFTLDPKGSMEITDAVLVGPTNPGPNGQYNKPTVAITQSGQSGTNYSYPYFLKLTRVRIEGEFFTGIIGNAGDGPLELTDCDITAYAQCVSWSATYNSGKSMIATNTYFHDAGLPGYGHLVYPSPAVSLDFQDCRFSGNFRRAVHHYGSGTIEPAFIRFLRCTFEDSLTDGIETNHLGLTEITDCSFSGGIGVALKGDTNITGSTFDRASINTYDIHSGVTVNISNSTFFGKGIINSVWKNCFWNISDCTFTGNGGYPAIGSNAIGTITNVDRCTFNGNWRRGIQTYAGIMNIRDSAFPADFVEGAVIIETTDPDAFLLVQRCTFGGAGRDVWIKRVVSPDQVVIE